MGSGYAQLSLELGEPLQNGAAIFGWRQKDGPSDAPKSVKAPKNWDGLVGLVAVPWKVIPFNLEVPLVSS